MRWAISRNFFWISSLIWSCCGPGASRSTGGSKSAPRRGSRRAGCFAGRTGGRCNCGFGRVTGGSSRESGSSKSSSSIAGGGGATYSSNGSRLSCFDSSSAALRRSAFVTLRIWNRPAPLTSRTSGLPSSSGGAAGTEAELRRRVDLLEVLADDRLLHLLLAPPLGEARPLQRQRAAGADELLLHAGEHRTETDARRQQHADEKRPDEHARRAGAVEIRGGGAIDLRAEVAAGGNQRAAQPQLPEREVEQRWHHDGQQREIGR